MINDEGFEVSSPPSPARPRFSEEPWVKNGPSLGRGVHWFHVQLSHLNQLNQLSHLNQLSQQLSRTPGLDRTAPRTWMSLCKSFRDDRWSRVQNSRSCGVSHSIIPSIHWLIIIIPPKKNLHDFMVIICHHFGLKPHALPHFQTIKFKLFPVQIWSVRKTSQALPRACAEIPGPIEVLDPFACRRRQSCWFVAGRSLCIMNLDEFGIIILNTMSMCIMNLIL